MEGWLSMLRMSSEGRSDREVDAMMIVSVE